MIRKSSCTSVHCGFRIFANLEIPPFGLASLSHAPPCRVVSCHPGIAALHASHCLVYPAVLFYPSCPGCNCQKPHLSSIFHPILPYSPHPSHRGESDSWGRKSPPRWGRQSRSGNASSAVFPHSFSRQGGGRPCDGGHIRPSLWRIFFGMEKKRRTSSSSPSFWALNT